MLKNVPVISGHSVGQVRLSASAQSMW